LSVSRRRHARCGGGGSVESAWQGRPAGDIGHLVGNHMATGLRRAGEAALLRRFHARLVAGGVAGYGFDAFTLDYRRNVLFGLAYLVDSIGVHDPANTRLVALLDAWSRRLAAAAADLDLEALA
jgi:hypothetical protein